MSAPLPSDLNTLTVAQLKEQLIIRHLDVKGKKADLVQRLQEALKNDKSTNSPTTETKPETQTKPPQAPTTTTPNSVENEDVDVTDDADNSAKKSDNSTQPPNNNNTNSTAPSENTSTSSNAISEEEKRKKRAERFGTTSTTAKPATEGDDKLKQRAERFGTSSKHKVGEVVLDKAKRLGLPVRVEAKGTHGGPKFAPLQKKEQLQRPLGIDKGNKVWSAEEEERKRKRAERFGIIPASSVPQAKKPKTDTNANGDTQVSAEPAKTEAAAS